MEVDFGESWVDIACVPCKVKYLVATLPYSNAYFAKAYPVERLESLLDGIESALRYFGGVVERVVLDYVPGNIVELMCPRRICGLGRNLVAGVLGPEPRGEPPGDAQPLACGGRRRCVAGPAEHRVGHDEVVTAGHGPGGPRAQYPLVVDELVAEVAFGAT